MSSQIRIGLGYDIHKYTPTRPLKIGGVEIPYAQGLDGHSDADVLLHALCDALLGALGWGDIGQLFPPGDPRYAGADSRELVKEIFEKVEKAGWQVVNVDSVIIAQKPRLSPYYQAMRDSIASLLKVSPEVVSIKATTPEKMGALGREEGMAAYCVVLLERRQHDSTS
ncbi:MAG: 2-C-methyl-D-erythritol 2,4-cyclodiphosphate synthase [Bacteroidia bacterium]|nr:2-C-methyl-D-erythritol 2,4-cyclodiphosphate synthase [Bacteroidia bacterium]MDW8235280.1 2-C-methyl-D-erythritol 2,4-cyclodiphosphate synthase [Bacteroidia bacterium]